MADKKLCGDCQHWNKRSCPAYDTDNIKKEAFFFSKDQSAICEGEHFKPKKGKNQERKPKPIYRDSGFSDQGCFEAIYHNEKPCFLVSNDKHFSLHESVTFGDKTLTPKDVQRIPYEPYGYYEGTIPNREDLFWRVRQKFKAFIDVEDVWIDVLSASVLLSYQQEKLQSVPYLFVFGDNESGKSTVLQLLKFLCYRPMYGVTVPSADIYGYLEDVNSIGCVLEDEIQGIDKDTDKIKIYKAGYKKGAVVPRTLMTQNDRIIKYYNTFAFKAVASEKIPTVKGFRERFIEISMTEGYPEKEWADITQEDLSRLQELRNILLKWRMLSKDWELPNPNVSMRGRLKEIWKPLLQVTHGLTIYDTLANFVENQKNERLSTKQNTLEGHIVKVVTQLLNQSDENLGYLPFQSIWFALAEDLDGKINEDKPHVMDTSEFFKVSKQKIGYRLREILSGKSKAIREGDTIIKGYKFNCEKLARIARKYGYDLCNQVTDVTDLQGCAGSNSASKNIKNHVKRREEKDRKYIHTFQENGYIGNTVTNSSETIDEALGDGKLPTCFDCGRTIFDPNQLTNWQGRFYCKRCLGNILSQRKGVSA